MLLAGFYIRTCDRLASVMMVRRTIHTDDRLVKLFEVDFFVTSI